jgi:hypothetical protein
MKQKLKDLFESLSTVKVKNLDSAYTYIGEELNELLRFEEFADMNNRKTQKNINKDYKMLKKIVKGKIDMNPSDLLNKYDENSNEYFFLKCLVKLIDVNQLSR